MLPPKPTNSHRALANYVLRLLGSKHGDTRVTVAEINVSAYDDLSAIRCLRETYPDRLSDCDCAEFFGPDGRLIWEQKAGPDA
ncbi:MAG: hypothetical protein WDM85_13135 [Caulobacteraceae bacterium]